MKRTSRTLLLAVAPLYYGRVAEGPELYGATSVAFS